MPTSSSSSASQTPPSSSSSSPPLNSETAGFDETAQKGKPGGLFRACMESLRSAHFRSGRLRAGLVVSGMFTDKNIYREVIASFYVVTKEMERKLQQQQQKDDDDSMVKKVLGLGYSFTEAYEKDLATLYSSETWRDQVKQVVDRNPVVRAYLSKVQGMNKGSELAGLACILWGGLVIGGGAVAMPRVKSLCGEDAIHLYKDVTGPGREQRKTKFIQVYDSLAEPGTEAFREVVQKAKECMQCNNDILSSLQRNPWWLNYVLAILVLVALYLLYFVYGARLLPTEDEAEL